MFHPHYYKISNISLYFYDSTGEKGLTFYIIISGEAIVLKAGIGQVAVLHKGHTFGELALTVGNDRRSATIRADTKVEILQLHKVDYDHFVKDIQLVEKRENLHVLRSCKLFENWPRTKVQKMCNFCTRMTIKPGENIYCQGDKPDKIYFIIEGQVDIFKEVYVVVRNRWPTGSKSWEGMAKKKVKPILAKSLHKDDFFGELVQDQRRTATATAKTRCTLLTLDRLEFIHLISGGRSLEELQSGDAESNSDKKILDMMLQQLSIKGGPSTTAQLNDYVKVINVNVTKKKRKDKASAAAGDALTTTSSMQSNLNTDQTIGTCLTEDDTATINTEKGLFSPVKTRKQRLSGSKLPSAGGRKRTDSSISASDTTDTNDSVTGAHVSFNVEEGVEEGQSSHNTDAFAHGLKIDRNKSTEFSFSSSTDLAKHQKLRHLTSAGLFETQLSRASSAVEDTNSIRAEAERQNSSTDMKDSATSNTKKKKEIVNLQEKQNQLNGKVSDLRRGSGLPELDSHLQMMVTEIVSSNKRSKYYDELAEMRFSAPSIVTRQSRRMNVLNGNSLKFGGSPNSSKQYFPEPTKTVYCPTKNLRKSKKNPKIKITGKINPVMTSVDSVVLKSDKGRIVRSYLSQDITGYLDATKSKSSSPTTLSPPSCGISRMKLHDELSSYNEKDSFPLKRIPTPKRDHERQTSRLVERQGSSMSK